MDNSSDDERWEDFFGKLSIFFSVLSQFSLKWSIKNHLKRPRKILKFWNGLNFTRNTKKYSRRANSNHRRILIIFSHFVQLFLFAAILNDDSELRPVPFPFSLNMSNSFRFAIPLCSRSSESSEGIFQVSLSWSFACKLQVLVSRLLRAHCSVLKLKIATILTFVFCNIKRSQPEKGEHKSGYEQKKKKVEENETWKGSDWRVKNGKNKKKTSRRRTNQEGIELDSDSCPIRLIKNEETRQVQASINGVLRVQYMKLWSISNENKTRKKNVWGSDKVYAN